MHDSQVPWLGREIYLKVMALCIHSATLTGFGPMNIKVCIVVQLRQQYEILEDSYCVGHIHVAKDMLCVNRNDIRSLHETVHSFNLKKKLNNNPTRHNDVLQSKGEWL